MHKETFFPLNNCYRFYFELNYNFMSLSYYYNRIFSGFGFGIGLAKSHDFWRGKGSAMAKS